MHDGTIYFANFADQRLYRQVGSTPPEPLTSPGYFYADCQLIAWRHRLVCIREDHTNEETVSKTEEKPREPVNSIVAVPIDSSAECIGRRRRFYSDPIVSPGGSRLAWLQWNHPNMPWDGTELWVAAIQPDGSLWTAEGRG